MALPFILYSITGHFLLQLLAVSLYGVGGGIVEGQASALLSDNHPGSERSILNISQTFFCIGASIGPFLIVIAHRINDAVQSSTILWLGSFATLLIFFGFIYLSLNDKKINEIRGMGTISFMRDKQWRLMCISIFLYVSVEMGTAGWLAKYGYEYLYLPVSLAPLLITAYWGGHGVSRFLVGMFSSNISNNKLLTISYILAFIFQVLSFSTAKHYVTMMFIFFLGFSMGCIWPTLVSMAGAQFKESSGAAVGFLIAAGAFGVPFIQQIMGFLSNPVILGLRFSLLSLSIFSFINIIILSTIISKRS
jgi:fucose permease